MSKNQITSTETRYSVIDMKVHDWKKDRFARFLHAGVAKIAADWLNSPEGNPDAYEWHGMLMLGDALIIAEDMQTVARAAGWNPSIPDLMLLLTDAEPFVEEVSK